MNDVTPLADKVKADKAGEAKDDDEMRFATDEEKASKNKPKETPKKAKSSFEDAKAKRKAADSDDLTDLVDESQQAIPEMSTTREWPSKEPETPPEPVAEAQAEELEELGAEALIDDDLGRISRLAAPCCPGPRKRQV